MTEAWLRLGRGSRTEPLCLGTLLLVPMAGLSSLAVGWGCALPGTRVPSGCLQTQPCALALREEMENTAWMYMGARCVCPHMHTHTP